LNGDEITILNAEKAILSGRKKSKVAEAKEFLEVGAPERGPFHYRRPDRIVKKTVRGMVPFKQPKGKNALKRLKVYMGVPKDFQGLELIAFDEARASKLKGPHITLGELAREIGWNQGE
jgi:large subunit ribosomal protein L13